MQRDARQDAHVAAAGDDVVDRLRHAGQSERRRGSTHVDYAARRAQSQVIARAVAQGGVGQAARRLAGLGRGGCGCCRRHRRGGRAGEEGAA